MIAWLVWFLLAPQLYWLDRVLESSAAPVLDIDVAIAFVLALSARTRSLPGLLLCAAFGRALLGGGPVALHFLALGLPIAALIPLRVVFFRGSVLWQGAAAAFLALAIPRVALFFGRLADTSLGALVLPPFWSIAVAAVLVPPMAWVLSRVPPLRGFVERST